MRREMLNTLKRRKTPQSMLKVTMLPLLLITMTLNAFIIWVLVILLQNIQKKVIIMKANNEVKTDGEDEREKMPPLEEVEDVYVEYSIKGDTLMLRRVLNMHVKMDDSED